VTPSVVNRGVSLRRSVPGVMSWVAIRPFPFPGIISIFQREELDFSAEVSREVWRVESGSVVRLGAMVIDLYGYEY